MSKFFAFNSTTNQRTLRLVDQFSVVDLQTDYPICMPGGRLTLSASNPIADGSGVSTLYYLPQEHSVLPLWNASAAGWVYRAIPNTGVSLSVASLLGNTAYDVCAYLNGGSISLSATAWSSSTARATALDRNSIYTLNTGSGNAARSTYLGSIYTQGATGSATLTDNTNLRLIYNAYRRSSKTLYRTEAVASWTYSSAAWRQWNNSGLNRVWMFDGIGTGILDLTFSARVNTPAGSYGQIGIGIDSITLPAGGVALAGAVALDTNISQRIAGTPGLGLHYVQALEYTAGGGNVTYYGGSVNGLTGTWQC